MMMEDRAEVVNCKDECCPTSNHLAHDKNDASVLDSTPRQVNITLGPWTLKATLREDNSLEVEALDSLRKDGQTFKEHFPSHEKTWEEFLIHRKSSLNGTDYIAAQNALIEAKNRAEEAVKAKSVFLANMSHEIRTPLCGIITLTQLLADDDLTPSQKDLVRTVSASGAILLGIVNDILDFSKLEATKVTLKNLVFNLETCIEGVCDVLVMQAQNKGLQLISYVDPTIPIVVQGDPGRLAQVLLNLLNNAIKFTAVGEVRIYVTIPEKDKKKSRKTNKQQKYIIEIADTGIGMTAEAQQRLFQFQPFTQIDSGSSRKYGGTGLGLVICNRLVGIMGGDISIKSELGKGSTFTVSVCLDLYTPSRHRTKRSEGATEPSPEERRIQSESNVPTRKGARGGQQTDIQINIEPSDEDEGDGNEKDGGEQEEQEGRTKTTQEYVDDYLPSTSTAPLLKGIEAKAKAKSEEELLKLIDQRSGATSDDDSDSTDDSSSGETELSSTDEDLPSPRKIYPSKSLPINMNPLLARRIPPPIRQQQKKMFVVAVVNDSIRRCIVSYLANFLESRHVLDQWEFIECNDNLQLSHFLKFVELMPQGAAARTDVVQQREETDIRKKMMQKQMSMGNLMSATTSTPLAVPTPPSQQRKSMPEISAKDARFVHGLIIDLSLLFRVAARKTTQRGKNKDKERFNLLQEVVSHLQPFCNGHGRMDCPLTIVVNNLLENNHAKKCVDNMLVDQAITTPIKRMQLLRAISPLFPDDPPKEDKAQLSADSNSWTKERGFYYNRRYSETTINFDDFDLQDYLRSNQEHLQAIPLMGDEESEQGEANSAPQRTLALLEKRKSSGITRRKGSNSDYLESVKEEMRKLKEEQREKELAKNEEVEKEKQKDRERALSVAAARANARLQSRRASAAPALSTSSSSEDLSQPSPTSTPRANPSEENSDQSPVRGNAFGFLSKSLELPLISIHAAEDDEETKEKEREEELERKLREREEKERKEKEVKEKKEQEEKFQREKEQKEKEASPQPAEGDVSTQQPQQQQNKEDDSVRVLIVEDNHINQKVLTRVLDRYIPGCRYTVANNGQEAVEELTSAMMDDKNPQFDIVLMDCMMPIMDGYEATRCIRALEKQVNKRRNNIIALTANAFSHDRQKCLDVGMDEYISKPVKANLLLDKFRMMIPDKMAKLNIKYT